MWVLEISAKKFLAFYQRIGKILGSWLEVACDTVSQERKELYTQCYALYPEVIWRRISKKNTGNRRNLTLIHGDAHPYQFYYPRNQGDSEQKAFLGDWEAWSLNIGTFDVSYLVGMFFTPARRKQFEAQDLLGHYYRTLVKFGVNGYSFEECYHDFRLGLINNFYSPIWNMNPKMFRHTAVLSFEDFNCKELLQEKND